MYSFTNKLINETSPYLLQHAHNPVNWYPWGDEALEKAVSEDKPILVSIGYSACHWCHVMERESFEDEATANLMNELFINIKIDREERPDLDHIYMDAVQAIAGNGGWPLNVFLTPSKKPFYGGTYFPPVRAFNRSSWKEVLTGVSTLFKDKRNEVEAQAEELVQHVGKPFIGIAGDLTAGTSLPQALRLKADTVFENIMKQADREWGGFGNAPKFPQSFTINYLLRYNHYTGNEPALAQALLSLDKMIEGGIYDQLAGGFARYSTDVEWLAPHFEKMLYDNALLLVSLADAYTITQKESYRTAIEGTIDFLRRELMDEGGAFYAALDADSEGVEGKFYVWSYDEVQQILKDEAALFCNYYNITPSGNWEHSNILRILKPLPAFAEEHYANESELTERLKGCRELLLRERTKRIRPALDNKILVSWNALMIVGLCKASAALESEDYKAMAIRCFDFIWSHCRNGDSFELSHSFGGKSNSYAFLDDYSGMIKACINLQEITSDTRFLDYAKGLLEFTAAHFLSGNGYFLYTGDKQSDIVVRKTEIYDGATPSGNSDVASSLYYLGVIFEKSEWKDQSYALISGISGMLEKYPGSFGNWGCFLIDLAYEINELAIVGEGYGEVRDNILKNFIPNKIVQAGDGVNMASFALLNQKPASRKPLLYLCRNYKCEAPMDDWGEALQQLVKKI